MNIFYGTAYSLAIASFAYIFVPPLYLFMFGVDSGMNHIDRIYPYPQSRQPLHKNPYLIYVHMYGNIIALGIQICLLYLHPPNIPKKLHSRLAWVYTFAVITGTCASMVYAFKQNYGNDAGKSGILAFGVMAVATFTTLAMAQYCSSVCHNAVLHREWAIRNFAVLFGNGVIFRVLSNTYMVYLPRWGADFYAAWCQMIYLSWLIPLFIAEQYISGERLRAHSIKSPSGERLTEASYLKANP